MWPLVVNNALNEFDPELSYLKYISVFTSATCLYFVLQPLAWGISVLKFRIQSLN